MRAARGRTPLGGEEWVEDGSPSGDAQPADVEALQAELQQRDEDLACQTADRRVEDHAEQLQERVKDLIIGAEPMANVLRLPGVKTFLLHALSSGQIMPVRARNNRVLKEAMQTINAAYAVIA